MVPSPARKISCRLITTYAGFENESTLLLELYKRGLQQRQIAPGFYAGDGLLMAWHHDPVRLQMLLNNLSSVGTEALARLGLEFKRLSSGVAIVAA